MVIDVTSYNDAGGDCKGSSDNETAGTSQRADTSLLVCQRTTTLDGELYIIKIEEQAML